MIKLEDYFRHRVSPQAYDLFAVFARFEYAMKKGGFLREGYPDAAWRNFSAALPADYFARMSAAPEAKIYFQTPPDHLVLDGNGGVRWSGAAKAPTTVVSLFESVKTARNNLFHGDKRHDSRRDHDLMVAGLFILNAAFESAQTDSSFDSFIDAMEYGL